MRHLRSLALTLMLLGCTEAESRAPKLGVSGNGGTAGAGAMGGGAAGGSGGVAGAGGAAASGGVAASAGMGGVGGVAASGGAAGVAGGTAGSGGASGGAGSAGASGSGGAAAGSGGAAGTGGTAGAAGTAGTGATGPCAPALGVVPALRLERVATGLDFPVFVSAAPGDPADRLYVVEQPGVVRVLEGGVPLPEPFVDLTAEVLFGGERGLLGLAFAPDYATSGTLYVHYSNELSGGDTRVARLQRSSTDPRRADRATLTEVLSIDQPQVNHNGGSIEFGPDGMLWIAMGDGGGTNDNDPGHDALVGNGQFLGTLLGKILRIDPAQAPYAIPPGNMTAGGALPELWSFGFRNPWRMSFDACNGDLYIGDVGQSRWEEISVEPWGTPSGRNYGWRLLEGLVCHDPSTDCDPQGLTTLPVAAYDHSTGVAVTGGYVYRGDAIPGLRGQYLYADYGTGRFWRLRTVAGALVEGPVDITADVNPTRFGFVSSFGQDAARELLVTVLSTVRPTPARSTGELWRLVPE